jgi:carboxypeptidase Q
MRKFALPVAVNVPLAALAAACLALTSSLPLAAQPPDAGPGGNRFGGFGRRTVDTNNPVYRIREEGMNHSQAMETLSYLSDVIGPRLTGSPNMKHANEWTRDKMASWGMVNAHLEAWGPFGRGWSLERFSAQVIEPQNIPLKAFPSAWSPGFDHPVEGEVIFLDATNTAGLEKYKGKLKGAIVLASPLREVPPRFEPLSRRYDATNLLDMANADVPRPGSPVGNPLNMFQGRAGTNAVAANAPAGADASGTNNTPGSGRGGRGRRGGGAGGAGGAIAADASTNAPAGTNAPGGRFAGRRGGANWARFIPFLMSEGVAVVAVPSSQGDAGTFFVQSATLPAPDTSTNDAAGGGGFGRGGGGGFANRPSAYATNAPETIPQMTLAVEDYNRLVRMAKFGEKFKMAVDLQVKFHTNDLMAYNTVAEIPGSDLKDQIVMVGGHMDSWHSGTGATDNGVGVAVAMEAARIIKACDLKPRRTIRVALWSGEEEGLLGSKAYVTGHFGYYTNLPPVTNTPIRAARSPRDAAENPEPPVTGRGSRTNRTDRGERKLIKKSEYDNLSVYFNLDNGAGKIRGAYLQGNEAMRPYFRKWLDPFRDLGAETLTPSNTGSTDHISFDSVGLPGFQFIQDPLDYGTRTHHSNEDVFDRIMPDDLKQAATIMAACVYEAAMADEKMPRKPEPETPPTRAVE